MADQLESRIQSSLPPLAYMVSRPRQPTTAREELLRRFDAGVRPYWLRDWQWIHQGVCVSSEWRDATTVLLPM